MHLGARVIQGRYQNEIVLPGLAVVHLFSNAGTDHVSVSKKNGLGLTCGAGGEIESTRIIATKRYLGGFRRRVFEQFGKRIGIIRNFSTGADVMLHRNLVPYGVYPLGEFIPKEQDVRLRNVEAVFDVFTGIAKV